VRRVIKEMLSADCVDRKEAALAPYRLTGTIPNIGNVLQSRSGIGGGFDFLRITLAYSVVAWHSIYIAEGSDPFGGTHFLWFPGYAILSMFFALSGFLITASAVRLSLSNFIINRALRIVPALLVDVVLSAIVLGTLFTSLSLSEYFHSLGFWRYFGNVLGAISLKLPGVFESNPDHSVNISLWTIPYEIGCYLLMTALILAKCLNRPKRVLALCLAFGAIAIAIYLAEPDLATESLQDPRAIFVGKGSRLFMSFILGIAMYLYRFHIAYSHRSAIACSLLCFAIAAIGPLPSALLNILLAPPLAYLTVYVGVSELPKLPLFKGGDYSYGIYLYGYPLQQTLITLLPLNGKPVALFIAVLPVVTAFAMLSWHAIECPILKVRHRSSFVAKLRIRQPRS
jgi:peptidoglycan/LPS O-acetylase OafA/YrhL